MLRRTEIPKNKISKLTRLYLQNKNQEQIISNQGNSIIEDNSIISMSKNYTSKIYQFENLPEPKNSDDYYKQYNNISSMEYSGN